LLSLALRQSVSRNAIIPPHITSALDAVSLPASVCWCATPVKHRISPFRDSHVDQLRRLIPPREFETFLTRVTQAVRDLSGSGERNAISAGSSPEVR